MEDKKQEILKLKAEHFDLSRQAEILKIQLQKIHQIQNEKAQLISQLESEINQEKIKQNGHLEKELS